MAKLKKKFENMNKNLTKLEKNLTKKFCYVKRIKISKRIQVIYNNFDAVALFFLPII